MQLELTKKQYETLCDLLFLGEYVETAFQDEAQAGKQTKAGSASADVINHVYSQAAGFGLKHAFRQVSGEYTLEANREEALIGLLEDFTEQNFWDHLSQLLLEQVVEKHQAELEAITGQEEPEAQVKELESRIHRYLAKKGISDLDLKKILSS